MSYSDPAQTPPGNLPVEAQYQFGTQTPPGSHHQEIPNQLGILSEMALQEQVNLLSQRNPSYIKTPKLGTPLQYDGSAEDFDIFWGDVNDYLKVKAGLFNDDFSKITFVSSLLSGSAKVWYQALRDRSRHYNVPELRNFHLFSSSFVEHFMNRESRSQAKMKLDKLRQGKKRMHDHLADAESLIIQAGLDVYSDFGIESVTKTLNADVKLDLRDTFLINSSMKTNYAEMKRYLKAKESNGIVSLEHDGYSVSIPGALPGNDPMDLSSFSQDTLKIKWKSLEGEKWSILKKTLLKLKCCLVCRDYVEFGHQEGSICKFKNKKFIEVFGNTADSSPYCLLFIY